METITSMLKLVILKTYFMKIDLKDAYYGMPIAPEHHKYLKLSHRNDLYQSTCLPNRYCHLPRKFKKSLKPPLFSFTLIWAYNSSILR